MALSDAQRDWGSCTTCCCTVRLHAVGMYQLHKITTYCATRSTWHAPTHGFGVCDVLSVRPVLYFSKYFIKSARIHPIAEHKCFKLTRGRPKYGRNSLGRESKSKKAFASRFDMYNGQCFGLMICWNTAGLPSKGGLRGLSATSDKPLPAQISRNLVEPFFPMTKTDATECEKSESTTFPQSNDRPTNRAYCLELPRIHLGRPRELSIPRGNNSSGETISGRIVSGTAFIDSTTAAFFGQINSIRVEGWIVYV